MAGGFAARADDGVGRTPGAGFERDDGAASELDVVGVRAEDQQGARSEGFFCPGFIGTLDCISVDERNIRGVLLVQVFLLSGAGDIVGAMDD